MSATALTLVTGCDRICTCTGKEADGQAILIGGRQVLGLLLQSEADALTAALPSLTRLDATGLVAVPGLVDLHVHVAGGGGEAGPSSRTPEARLSELLLAGITTVVGTTGTDSVSRSQENLLAKVHALSTDGITAFSWAGSYRLPPATATGSIQRELCLIDSCIGVGEVAVSDHRGSAPTPLELAKLGLEARVGGLLGGKVGLVHCHMGPGDGRLRPLREALAAASGDLPITTFHPTHMDRSPELAGDGIAWLADGGTLDLTCSSASCREVLRQYRSQHVPLTSVTVSSDAYGSLPVFDERGQLVGYDVADPGAMLRFLQAMCLDEGWPLEEVLCLLTANPARILRLPSKGCIAVGCDADILLLKQDTLELQYVIAKGEIVKTPDWVRGGMFERGPGIRPRSPQTAARLEGL